MRCQFGSDSDSDSDWNTKKKYIQNDMTSANLI